MEIIPNYTVAYTSPEAVHKIIARLKDIFLDNVPENFQEFPTYENAESSAAFIMDAIASLKIAYV